MGQRLWRHRWGVVLMALSGTASVVVALWVFPDGSPNFDEVAYLSQADALRHGRLTLSASTHDPYFLPFLSGVDNGRVVFKYQPFWPGFLAVVRAVTGSYLPALAVATAAATGTVYWFAWELTRRRRVTIAATVLFACSPFVLVQSGTYLAYLSSVAVLSAAGAALLRARATSSPAWFVASGALFGVACFHRLFDAVLFGLPLLVWLVASSTGDRAALRSRLAQIVAGAAPFLALILVYNWRVTGRALQMPFTVGAPIDTFGFGRRASFGSGAAGIDYGFGTALSTAGAFAGSLQRWLVGGLAFLVLAAIAVGVGRRDPRVLLAAGIVVAFPTGYLFWWGTGNAVRFHLHDLLGPFYWLPALPALCVLVGLGAAWLWTRRRAALTVFVVASIALAALWFPSTYSGVRDAADARSRVATLEASVGDDQTLVLMPPQFGPDRYAATTVSPDLRAGRLVAFLPDDPGARFELFDRFPDRAVSEVYRTRPVGDIFSPHSFAVRTASERRLESWVITLEIANPSAAPVAVAYLRAGDEEIEVPIPALGRGFQRVSFRVEPGPRTEVTGPTALTVATRQPIRVAAGVALGDGDRIEDLEWFELRWDVMPERNELRVQDPPASWQRVVFPQTVWGEADVSSVVRSAS